MSNWFSNASTTPDPRAYGRTERSTLSTRSTSCAPSARRRMERPDRAVTSMQCLMCGSSTLLVPSSRATLWSRAAVCRSSSSFDPRSQTGRFSQSCRTSAPSADASSTTPVASRPSLIAHRQVQLVMPTFTVLASPRAIHSYRSPVQHSARRSSPSIPHHLPSQVGCLPCSTLELQLRPILRVTPQSVHRLPLHCSHAACGKYLPHPKVAGTCERVSGRVLYDPLSRAPAAQ